jgi:hypothetical protein
METKTVRIPVVDPKPLDQRINEQCVVMQAADFKLAAMTAIDGQLLLVFQTK